VVELKWKFYTSALALVVIITLMSGNQSKFLIFGVIFAYATDDRKGVAIINVTVVNPKRYPR
tara:strand:+ start:696 stop:881 length:186 start_codon:yes stop_codon:yes gene_type:complete